MTNLARYEYKVPSVFDYINRFMDWPSSETAYSPNDASFVETGGWAPSVDIKSESDRFLITADIPGVDCKDIEINMENGVLSIKGERSLFNKEERKGYTRVERSQGKFYRRFTLPDTADSDKISARSKNGVLEIEIPKKEKSLLRKITIKEE
ncbi:Hsp20/alpha crystallin family protein [Rickettsiella endosymbiont of Dermanyssus gallinae]|uniref:Hsp20/alpha crystallin family protein n=1 Tax=Rickettsiella endosymbiont of Dermanyssus gallinae TaxID=2856608 RepID=UPI001C52DECA|nr:Hsp20/alpha crystallin family protein [Rickettsiella endosymbiont of Dermanyssus gallinae]